MSKIFSVCFVLFASILNFSSCVFAEIPVPLPPLYIWKSNADGSSINTTELVANVRAKAVTISNSEVYIVGEAGINGSAFPSLLISIPLVNEKTSL